MKFLSLEAYGADKSSNLFIHWGWEPVTSPDEADIIIFNGGADIGTSMYGETPINSGIPYQASERDLYEKDLYSKYATRKFLLGICRGAQLLNVLNGGSLWQDVNNHNKSHMMIDLNTGEEISVTSVHHQQMKANPLYGLLIGASNVSTHKVSDGVDEIIKPRSKRPRYDDAEVIWYYDTQCLCVQGHPEYVPESRFADWTRELIIRLMGDR